MNKDWWHLVAVLGPWFAFLVAMVVRHWRRGRRPADIGDMVDVVADHRPDCACPPCFAKYPTWVAGLRARFEADQRAAADWDKKGARP